MSVVFVGFANTLVNVWSAFPLEPVSTDTLVTKAGVVTKVEWELVTVIDTGVENVEAACSAALCEE